jgi:imidazolonepropionase-like amidohydrolase
MCIIKKLFVKKLSVYLLLMGLALSPTFYAAGQTIPQKTYLLKAGKFYDSEKNIFLVNQQILIEGKKITKIGKNITAPKGSVILELPNATVTPGLIDAHTHLLTLQKINDNLAIDAIMNSGEARVLRGAGLASTFLEAGFTSIRDLGNSGYYLDVELKRAINKGYVPGPKMFVSGPILSAIDGQFFQLPVGEQERVTRQEYRVIKGVEDARTAVKEHVNNSVDVIKIVAFGERLGLSKEEMKTIVQTAHENRLKVTAHATADWVIRDAIEAGVHGIEHAYNISDSTLDLMKSKNIYLVPTDPSLASYIKSYEAMNIRDYSVDDIKKELGAYYARVKRVRDKGVMIVAGSDMYIDLKVPQGEAAKETLAGYFEGGMKPADVLQTATVNAAFALGKSGQLGVLKEDVNADIVIFDGDLEKDFASVLFKIKFVFKDGSIVYSK